MRKVTELYDDTAAAVASFEQKLIKKGRKIVGQIVKIRLWDKNAALEKAMKFHGLFEKDNKQRPPEASLRVEFVKPPPR